jgi:hypothetical protein|tara:strand:- start:233 stop:481 length:249 start_codon:yes stop_codon:yes gene_type:complete
MTIQEFQKYAIDNKKKIVNAVDNYGNTLHGIEVSKGCFYYFGKMNNGKLNFYYAESTRLKVKYNHFKATSTAMKICLEAERI